MAKLYVISFEGMNYEILENLIEENRLSNFKRIKQEGHIGKLETSRVPYEASGLTSAFSGLEDYEHGVLSYWKAHNQDYIPKTYNSNDIKENMIWLREELSDYRFGIVNFFGTHPVYKVNGFLISYAMNRTLRFSYPTELINNLVNQGLPYVQDMGAFFNGQSKKEFLDEVFRVENMRHQVCRKIIEQDVDVVIINYTCIDRVCHFYMNELKDGSMDINDKAVYQMYKQCDMVLGDILEYASKDNADILMFSSVGFNHLNKFVEINSYLNERKLLTWSDNLRVPDWKKTIAFEAVQGTQGININRESFYQDGIVKDSEYQDVLNHVISQLIQMPNPYNNNPMFKDVILGSEFYHGISEAPDIVVLPYDNKYLPYGDSYWSDRVKRHSQTGWHSINTVWGGLGPNISNKISSNSNCHITQIAPTINHILGTPIKNYFNKESLLKA